MSLWRQRACHQWEIQAVGEISGSHLTHQVGRSHGIPQILEPTVNNGGPVEQRQPQLTGSTDQSFEDGSNIWRCLQSYGKTDSPKQS